jgi:hypothetical protein
MKQKPQKDVRFSRNQPIKTTNQTPNITNLEAFKGIMSFFLTKTKNQDMKFLSCDLRVTQYFLFRAKEPIRIT